MFLVFNSFLRTAKLLHPHLLRFQVIKPPHQVLHQRDVILLGAGDLDLLLNRLAFETEAGGGAFLVLRSNLCQLLELQQHLLAVAVALCRHAVVGGFSTPHSWLESFASWLESFECFGNFGVALGFGYLHLHARNFAGIRAKWMPAGCFLSYEGFMMFFVFMRVL